MYGPEAGGLRHLHLGEVVRNLHGCARTSSRTRWRRIREGRSERSKKKAATASFTFRRNPSQSSACVKMPSVRHSATKPPSPSGVTSKTNSFMLPSLRQGKLAHQGAPSAPARHSMQLRSATWGASSCKRRHLCLPIPLLDQEAPGVVEGRAPQFRQNRPAVRVQPPGAGMRAALLI